MIDDSALVLVVTRFDLGGVAVASRANITFPT
jgi:hypothetical protein